MNKHNLAHQHALLIELHLYQRITNYAAIGGFFLFTLNFLMIVSAGNIPAAIYQLFPAAASMAICGLIYQSEEYALSRIFYLTGMYFLTFTGV